MGAVIGGSFLATGQPLVNLFDVRLFLVTSIALLLMLLSGFDGVTGMLSSARKTLADALRGAPVRYGSFVPHDYTARPDRRRGARDGAPELRPGGTWSGSDWSGGRR